MNKKDKQITSESLLKAVEDNEFENGRYEITVNDEIYNAKVYNIDGSMEIKVDMVDQRECLYIAQEL